MFKKFEFAKIRTVSTAHNEFRHTRWRTIELNKQSLDDWELITTADTVVSIPLSVRQRSQTYDINRHSVQNMSRYSLTLSVE